METSRDRDVYVKIMLAFRDKPSLAMMQVALRKTAQENKADYPEAAEVLTNNVYTDDICESNDTVKEARKLTEGVDEVLKTGAFNLKGWISNKVLTEKASRETERAVYVFQGDPCSISRRLSST